VVGRDEPARTREGGPAEPRGGPPPARLLEEATGCLEQSLTLARATGDRGAEAYALCTLGDLLRQQGRLKEAASCLEHSLATFHDIGFRSWEARALTSLGTLLAKRDPTAAYRAWKSALAIFRELNMPEAADVAARLAEPPTLAT
jgi:tetratricopeptide (TPR) repeat protein